MDKSREFLYNFDIGGNADMRHNYYADDLEHDIVGTCPHDAYYIAPKAVDLNNLYMQVNRAGIVMQTPRDFLISRDDAYRYSLIHCVIYGKGSVSYRGHTFAVHAGQAFVFAPNEGHMYNTDPRDPMGLVWVEYGGGNSAQLTAHILDLGGPIYEGRTFVDVLNLITSILYQPRQEGPGISLKLYEILMCLCKRVEIESSSRPVNHEILKYIDENIDHRLSLTEISRAFGYHPAYFSSFFSKMMGTTFSKYVMNRKISHACYLLETTSWSVERIAQELGFCDISHFIQRFKAIKGVTPMAYRSSSVLYQKKHGSRRVAEG